MIHKMNLLILSKHFTMKTAVIALILYITTFTSFSQTKGLNQYPPISKERFMVGFSYSPDLSYRFLTAQNGWEPIADIRNKEEQPKYGTHIGLTFWGELKNYSKLAIDAGIYIANKGEESIFYSDLTEPKEIHTVKFINTYTFLYVPFKLSHYFKESKSGKFRFYVTGGLSGNMFLDDLLTTIVTFNDGKQNKSSFSPKFKFATLHYGIEVGGGVDFFINPKLMVRAAPSFRQAFTSINRSKSVTTNLKGYYYSAGLNLAIFINAKEAK